jgi:hypothetical protein
MIALGTVGSFGPTSWSSLRHRPERRVDEAAHQHVNVGWVKQRSGEATR